MTTLNNLIERVQPQRELMLNRQLLHNGRPAVLASLTEQDGCLMLWLLEEPDFGELTESELNERPEFATNRQEKCWYIKRDSVRTLDLCGLSIQGTELQVKGSSSSCIGGGAVETTARFWRFLEKGVDFTSLGGTQLDRLLLTGYKFRGTSRLPELDPARPLDIRLRTRDERRQCLLGEPLRLSLEFGEYGGENPLSFTDSETGESHELYINALETHDIRAQTEEQLQSEAFIKQLCDGGFDEEQIEQHRRETRERFSTLCPEGEKMLLLQYECPEDIQLDFYRTALLDAGPERHSSASSVAILAYADSKHGRRVKTANLGSIGADGGKIEIELLSMQKTIPGSTITVD